MYSSHCILHNKDSHTIVYTVKYVAKEQLCFCNLAEASSLMYIPLLFLCCMGRVAWIQLNQKMVELTHVFR